MSNWVTEHYSFYDSVDSPISAFMSREIPTPVMSSPMDYVTMSLPFSDVDKVESFITDTVMGSDHFTA